MKRNNYKIGVFDSGLGGLSTLKEIRKILPNENYIYYYDNKNIPYGEKTQEELEEITSSIVDYLIKQNVKIIVIACNTATTRCIKYLRSKYPNMIFIGTEPAIKVAIDKGYKNTLVLCTPLTAKSDKLYELITKYSKEDNLFNIVPCPNLAKMIETKDKNKIKLLIYSLIYDYKKYDYDSIVLGCTHYLYIKNDLKKIFPNAKIIDGNKGVSKEVERQLINNNLLTDRKTKGNLKCIYSKK